MPEAQGVIKKLFLSIFALFVLFSLTTCGLDTYSIVPAPTSVIHEPVYTSADYAANYFSFTAPTVGENDVPNLRFLGTAVYYRIYANSSTMLSRQSSISAVNTASDYSAAATKMIGYGYQQLNTSLGNVQPLINADGGVVTIRLTNYGDEDNPNNEYRAQISVLNRVPRRAIGTTKTFDFGRNANPKYNSEYNALPASGDEDFESGTVSDNKYYVDMYAVCLGRDSTYTIFYSNVLHLGSVPIDMTAENN